MKFSVVSTLENRRENLKLNVVLVIVLVLESNSYNTENTTTPTIVRLQNSPYFCVFKYAREVKRKVWNETENRERDWGETLRIRTGRFAYVIFVRITRFSQPRAIPFA